VYIKGLARLTATFNGLVLTLPVGYRPDTNIMFSQMVNDSPWTCRMDVRSDGQILVGAESTTSVSPVIIGSWISLVCSFYVG